MAENLRAGSQVLKCRMRGIRCFAKTNRRLGHWLKNFCSRSGDIHGRGG